MFDCVASASIADSCYIYFRVGQYLKSFGLLLMCIQERAYTNFSNKIKEPKKDTTNIMESYCFGLCFLLCTLDMAFLTQACQRSNKQAGLRSNKPAGLRSNICGDNQNADKLIHGDSQNDVTNFAFVVKEKRQFSLVGDNVNYVGGCRRSAGANRHRQGRYYDGEMWTLDCWDPLECTLIETEEHHTDCLKLIPFSSSPSGHVHVKTVLLTIDERNTSSYTFLPDATHKSYFFVTSMLSGCSVFVVKPDNINCNLIVMHTNYFCDSHQHIDYNHKQAMAVLELVGELNKHCRYNVQAIRRWAADTNRDTIIAQNYPYANNIFFYNTNYYNFIYGFKVDGVISSWHFCMKELYSGPPSEHCISI